MAKYYLLIWDGVFSAMGKWNCEEGLGSISASYTRKEVMSYLISHKFTFLNSSYGYFSH